MRLVDFETAKTLQKLGYDGCHYYVYDEAYNPPQVTMTYKRYVDQTPCPRIDDATYWIRRKYGIAILPSPFNLETPDRWDCFISNFKANAGRWLEADKGNYTDALEAGLKKVLEVITTGSSWI